MSLLLRRGSSKKFLSSKHSRICNQTRQQTILSSSFAARSSEETKTIRLLPVSPVSGGRHFSWQGHGTDLLAGSLAHTGQGEYVPKIVLHGYGSSGIDVVNLIKNKDPTDVELVKSGGIVHMAGSVLALPGACFLWKVRSPKDLTSDSLAPILLHKPKLEYLFLGSVDPIQPSQIQKLRDDFAAQDISLVIEPMDVANAIGTFNILNGEDRMVGVAIILPETEDDEDDEDDVMEKLVENKNQ